jgi:transcriptional regulator with XRE-family HTH domain
MSLTPGGAIRKLRGKLGLTLQDVSGRTGLAVSTLSKLENGTISLSFEKLELLSKGLRVPMAELLGTIADEKPATPQFAGRRSIQRAGEGLQIETGAYLQSFLAVDLLKKQFIPMCAEVRCRTIDEFIATVGKLIEHEGEEFTYVLEGEVELHSELYAPVRLKQGESIYFDSRMPHAYLAVSDGPCRVLNISTGPDYSLLDPNRNEVLAEPPVAKTKSAARQGKRKKAT